MKLTHTHSINKIVKMFHTLHKTVVYTLQQQASLSLSLDVLVKGGSKNVPLLNGRCKENNLCEPHLTRPSHDVSGAAVTVGQSGRHILMTATL